MKYKVIRYFRDLQDDNYLYHEGDIFPRDGMSVSSERIKELSSVNNKQKTILIEAITEDNKQSKHTRTEISQMNTENLQKLADSVGIENAYETSGRKLKEILIKHYNL